jgi:hypothetical protein
MLVGWKWKRKGSDKRVQGLAEVGDSFIDLLYHIVTTVSNNG